MDERQLLVLGLLKNQRQHGYQINEFIENNLGKVSDMKKATAYSLLKRMHEHGWVEVHVVQDSNRPPKQVYEITTEGEKVFEELLMEGLGHIEDITPHGDISFMFMNHLPLPVVITQLNKRLENLNEIHSVYQQMPDHKANQAVQIGMEHRKYILSCEIQWLSELIQRLQLEEE